MSGWAPGGGIGGGGGGPPISVDIDAFTNPPDSILIVGSEDGTITGVRHVARVDSALDLLVGLSNGANKAAIDASGQLSVTDALLNTKINVSLSTRASESTLASALAAILASNAALALLATESTLSSLSAKFNTLGQKVAAGSVPVVLASDQPAIPVNATVVGGTISADLDAFSATPDNVMLVGTEDGTKTGIKRGYINNLRGQILATHDRTQALTYADFGTKNQRITQIDYQSPTFPSVTARKVISYTLVGNRYRRDTINWVIV